MNWLFDEWKQVQCPLIYYNYTTTFLAAKLINKNVKWNYSDIYN